VMQKSDWTCVIDGVKQWTDDTARSSVGLLWAEAADSVGEQRLGKSVVSRL
jgi:hypothetical protein